MLIVRLSAPPLCPHDQGGVHKAVLAVETMLAQISEKLAHFNSLANVGLQGGDAIFIVDRQGLLVGSSDKVVTKGEPGVGVNAKDQRISPSESPNLAVRATYEGLLRWMQQPAEWKPPVSLVVNQDGEAGPYVAAVSSIKDADGMDWLLVSVRAVEGRSRVVTTACDE